MITLDETIEQERKQAEMYRSEYECECDYYGKGFVDDHADEFECIKKIHEHEQLADWLEELKELRANSSCGYNKEDIELNRNAMYNKAIDDVRDMLLDLISNGYKYPNIQFLEGLYGVINDAMDDVVEQLKECEVK